MREQWTRAFKEFERLANLPPAEAQMQLNAIRAINPDLAVLIDQLHNGQNVSLHAIPWSDAVEPDVGEKGVRIGAYKLIREIGRGGMGTVWLGERADGLYVGNVAIKLLNAPTLRDLGARERFTREGEILAKLTHPNITRLLDAGTSADGLRYLVLEHVDGDSLLAYCKAQAVGFHERIALFMQTLEAVMHAHAQLILHRDIKPNNILVTHDGQVKLLDFGLGKLLSDSLESIPDNVTRLAGIGYTLRYAPPEQIRGGTMTTASDVYSLGVTLYELLTDVDFDPSKASSRPSECLAEGSGGKDWSKLVRGDIDSIIAKAVSESPAERYPNAMALRDDLQRFLRSEPVTAQPDSPYYRTQKFLRRNTFAVGSAALATLLVLMSLAVSMWQWSEARKERDEARYQELAANTSADIITAIYDEIGASESRESNLARIDRAYEIIRKPKRMDPPIRASLLVDLALRYGILGEKSRANALREEAIAEVAPLIDTDRHAFEVATVARCQIAEEVSHTDPKRGETLMVAALSPLEARRELSADARVACWHAGASLFRRIGDDKLARTYNERAWKVIEASAEGRVHYTLRLVGLERQAQEFGRVGNFTQAVALFTRALDELKARGAEHSLSAFVYAQARARFALAGGDLKLVDKFASREVPVYLSLRPDKRLLPGTAGLLSRRALISADFASAAVAAQTGLEAARSGSSLVSQIAALTDLAIAQTYSGNAQLADEALGEAKRLAIGTKATNIRSNLAVTDALLTLSRQGDGAAALAALNPYLKQEDAEVSYSQLGVWIVAARASLAAGETRRALDFCNRALSEAERSAYHKTESLWIGQALHCKAAALRSTGQNDDAARAAQRANLHWNAVLSANHPALIDPNKLIPRM